MWYKIKEEVEYSTDINFFLKEQISVWKSHTKYHYNSRLESKCFLFERAINGPDYSFSDEHILEACKRIHKEILEGKHGAGTLVN